MKIGNGQPTVGSSSLIERMQKAHAKEKTEVEEASSFSVDAPAPPPQTKEASPLEKSVMGIAERVLDGDLDDPSQVRREVISSIVDDRYGAMIDPESKQQTVDALEVALSDDPAFAAEVDNMLILAAQELATAPD